MGKEILKIPKEHLTEVINIIHFGLKTYQYPSKEVEEMLIKWCEDGWNYINDVKD